MANSQDASILQDWNSTQNLLALTVLFATVRLPFMVFFLYYTF